MHHHARRRSSGMLAAVLAAAVLTMAGCGDGGAGEAVSPQTSPPAARTPAATTPGATASPAGSPIVVHRVIYALVLIALAAACPATPGGSARPGRRCRSCSATLARGPASQGPAPVALVGQPAPVYRKMYSPRSRSLAATYSLPSD